MIFTFKCKIRSGWCKNPNDFLQIPHTLVTTKTRDMTSSLEAPPPLSYHPHLSTHEADHRPDSYHSHFVLAAAKLHTSGIIRKPSLEPGFFHSAWVFHGVGWGRFLVWSRREQCAGLGDWICYLRRGALRSWDLKFQPGRWSWDWVLLAKG